MYIDRLNNAMAGQLLPTKELGAILRSQSSKALGRKLLIREPPVKKKAPRKGKEPAKPTGSHIGMVDERLGIAPLQPKAKRRRTAYARPPRIEDPGPMG